VNAIDALIAAHTSLDKDSSNGGMGLRILLSMNDAEAKRAELISWLSFPSVGEGQH
jgi:hypothetical protein